MSLKVENRETDAGKGLALLKTTNSKIKIISSTLVERTGCLQSFLIASFSFINCGDTSTHFPLTSYVNKDCVHVRLFYLQTVE